jgi:hypothetical protein
MFNRDSPESKLHYRIRNYLNGYSFKEWTKKSDNKEISCSYDEWLSRCGCISMAYDSTLFGKIHNVYDYAEKNKMNWTSPCVLIGRADPSVSEYNENARKQFVNTVDEGVIKGITPLWKKIYEYIIELLEEYDMVEEFYRDNIKIATLIKTGEIPPREFTEVVFTIPLFHCINSEECKKKLKENNEKKWKEYNLQKQQKEKQIYEREFECMTLFNRIERERMKNKEIYTEYCILSNLKKEYRNNGWNINTKFLDYFTNEKVRYISELLVSNATL